MSTALISPGVIMTVRPLSHQECSCFDPIGNDWIIAATAQPLHPFNGDHRATGTGHPGSHGVQEVGQILDFWLLGSVLDGRGSIGQNSGHQDGLCGTDAGTVEHDLSA